MNYIISQLPPHLFWDSDMSKLDDVEHYEKIIVRTFERGDLDDMATVMAYYGKDICRDTLMKATYLMERAMIFGSLFLGISIDAFPASKVTQHHAI
jgi:hypothetical protein